MSLFRSMWWLQFSEFAVWRMMLWDLVVELARVMLKLFLSLLTKWVAWKHKCLNGKPTTGSVVLKECFIMCQDKMFHHINSLLIWMVKWFTKMTLMQPDVVAVVFAVAPHGVVGKVTLSYHEVGVYYDLSDRKTKILLLVLRNRQHISNPFHHRKITFHYSNLEEIMSIHAILLFL